MAKKSRNPIEDYIEANSVQTGVNMAAFEPTLPVVQPTLFVESFKPRQFFYTLPWPPSMNTYWRSVVRKTSKGMKIVGTNLHCTVTVYLSEGGKLYKQSVARAVRESGCIPKSRARLQVVIHAFPPDKRSRDIDNVLKAVNDSMQEAGVFVDDEQIDDLRIIRCSVGGKKRARVEVSIQELAI